MLFVVNASQALGACPIDVSATPVDAVVACGYKWLCGPYGTGFAWLHPDLLDRLRPQQAYWLAMQAGRGLDQMRETSVRDDLGVRAFDVSVHLVQPARGDRPGPGRAAPGRPSVT